MDLLAHPIHQIVNRLLVAAYSGPHARPGSRSGHAFGQHRGEVRHLVHDVQVVLHELFHVGVVWDRLGRHVHFFAIVILNYLGTVDLSRDRGWCNLIVLP